MAGFEWGYETSSFSDYLRANSPELLPWASFERGGVGKAGVGEGATVHGTTIVAVSYDSGVLLAGDRRGTMGNLLASRDMQKVYITDAYSAAGFAGTVATAVEMIRLFAVELEHYEKIESVSLTFDGKANKLSKMVRDNLPAALQDMTVVPLLVGYDVDAADQSSGGRIFSYDVVGGRSEERFGYAAVGSGSLFAKSSLKKTYARGIDEDRALRIAVESLFDAAEDDTATGGPDVARGIYPTAVIVDSEGARDVPEGRFVEVTRGLLRDRTVERS